ncbi:MULTISPECIES: helix-turn-helix domain-containing protein [unclassified Acidocella]|uniref:helix-turn-helix domain-containing protein n=1 Tax=unclassified Acidocella TaxID=2648610 RepID=UPI00034590D0|nr:MULTISPECIES: helix-turn-helix domain-containing protein [unclassified Acidocella]WBO60408.1 helix-turn-helix domain-containing protein [Acidocella sp. MX-AZ03]
MPSEKPDDSTITAMPAAMPAAQYLTYAEAARIFGRSPRTIRYWVAQGHLRAIRIGHARLIPFSEIQRLGNAPALPESAS